MVEIETLFQTKTAKNERPFGAALTYTAYIRDYPPSPLPGAKNALKIMSLAAYANETNKSERDVIKLCYFPLAVAISLSRFCLCHVLPYKAKPKAHITYIA